MGSMQVVALLAFNKDPRKLEPLLYFIFSPFPLSVYFSLCLSFFLCRNGNISFFPGAIAQIKA